MKSWLSTNTSMCPLCADNMPLVYSVNNIKISYMSCNVIFLLEQPCNSHEPTFSADRRHGVLGLYKGLEAKLLQTVLTAALMFVVYEKIMRVTFKVMGLNKKLKHWCSFTHVLSWKLTTGRLFFLHYLFVFVRSHFTLGLDIASFSLVTAVTQFSVLHLESEICALMLLP